jgi:hypothetical protein
MVFRRSPMGGPLAELPQTASPEFVAAYLNLTASRCPFNADGRCKRCDAKRCPRDQVAIDSRRIRNLDRPGRWHSQVATDQIAANLLGHKRDGFFVDISSEGHPLLNSRSRALERDFAWNGLCVLSGGKYRKLHQALGRSCSILTGDNSLRPASVLANVLAPWLPRCVDYVAVDDVGKVRFTGQLAAFILTTRNVSVVSVVRPPKLLRATLHEQGFAYVCTAGWFLCAGSPTH